MYLSIYLSMCLSGYLSLYLPFFLPIYLHIFLSLYLSFFLSIYTSLSVSLSSSSTLTPRSGALLTQKKVPAVEDIELWYVLPLNSGVGQNIATRALPTAWNFFFNLDLTPEDSLRGLA